MTQPNPIDYLDQVAAAVLGLRRNTARAVEAGRLGAAAGERWLDHLSSGPFLATAAFFVVLAEAPH
ncbi:hypothetical protein [Spirillospora sp. NBC_01491]|uniref:hypothetical protein n=1 Tax=Spirillospora sp. NBC_01491 TaxID=2976007 RepID=UPI002E2F8503|nr:hypothetical protein [Spirillospora sp. NBC_01491]